MVPHSHTDTCVHVVTHVVPHTRTHGHVHTPWVTHGQVRASGRARRPWTRTVRCVRQDVSVVRGHARSRTHNAHVVTHLHRSRRRVITYVHAVPRVRTHGPYTLARGRGHTPTEESWWKSWDSDRTLHERRTSVTKTLRGWGDRSGLKRRAWGGGWGRGTWGVATTLSNRDVSLHPPSEPRTRPVLYTRPVSGPRSDVRDEKPIDP